MTNRLLTGSPQNGRKAQRSWSYDDDEKEEEEEGKLGDGEVGKKPGWISSNAVHPQGFPKVNLPPLTVRGDVRGTAAIAVGRLGSLDVQVQ